MNKKSLVYSILIYVIFCLIPVKTLYANQNLTKAVELMDELQYEEAAHLINMARTTKGNKKTDLIDIYKLTGIVSAITENEGKAVWAFQRLLCIQPEFQLPKGSSPKIAKLFKEAKSSISRRGTLALFQKQLKTPYLDKSIMLKVELKDPLNMVDSIVYSFRKRGDENFLRGKMEKVIHFRGIIPPVPANKDGSSPALEYYIEALDEFEGVLHMIGTANKPIVMNFIKTPIIAHSKELRLNFKKHIYSISLLSGGVIVLGAGAFAGIKASTINDRAVDSNENGVLDITRKEGLEGKNYSMTANILFGLGSAVLISSAVMYYFESDSDKVINKSPDNISNNSYNRNLNNGLNNSDNNLLRKLSVAPSIYPLGLCIKFIL